MDTLFPAHMKPQTVRLIAAEVKSPETSFQKVITASVCLCVCVKV